MAQTSNNNLSCLPLYTVEGEISSNLPWAFGDIFPLRCEERILPFFGTRYATEEIAPSDIITPSSTDDDLALIMRTGTVYADAQGYVIALYTHISTQYAFDIGDGRLALWVENLIPPADIAGVETCNVFWQTDDASDLYGEVYGTADEPYTGYLILPKNADMILIQYASPSGAQAHLMTLSKQIYRIKTGTLISPDGSETVLSLNGAVVSKNIGDYDIYYYSGDTPLLTDIVDPGTYRLRFEDGRRTILTDWFTYGRTPNVRIEWYDATDQQLGEGYIPYSFGYRNRLWLNTSVGLPEYEIDKEGDERDGYFFMEKGVSRKSYKLQFYGPEYLCDVLRLVPVSDYVKIYDTSRGKEIEYDVDDIDMEVEWQEQGNYAAITLTFKTDTVIKNLGKIV